MKAHCILASILVDTQNCNPCNSQKGSKYWDTHSYVLFSLFVLFLQTWFLLFNSLAYTGTLLVNQNGLELTKIHVPLPEPTHQDNSRFTILMKTNIFIGIILLTNIAIFY